MKIIAVDDEYYALRGLVSAIEESLPDCYLKGFDSPVSALDYAKMNKVDYAFLDVNMPVMNGLEIAKHLKKLDPNIRTIFVIGSSQYEIERLGLKEVDCIFKPVEARKIRRHLL